MTRNGPTTRPGLQAVRQLREHGQLHIDTHAAEQLLKGPMCCHRWAKERCQEAHRSSLWLCRHTT